MGNPLFDKRDALADLERAQFIVQQAVAEGRSMTLAEARLVAGIRETAEPMLARADEELRQRAQTAASGLE